MLKHLLNFKWQKNIRSIIEPMSVLLAKAYLLHKSYTDTRHIHSFNFNV